MAAGGGAGEQGVVLLSQNPLLARYTEPSASSSCVHFLREMAERVCVKPLAQLVLRGWCSAGDSHREDRHPFQRPQSSQSFQRSQPVRRAVLGSCGVNRSGEHTQRVLAAPSLYPPPERPTPGPSNPTTQTSYLMLLNHKPSPTAIDF